MSGAAGPDAAEPVSFCERWNTNKAKPIRPLTAAEARRRDQAKEWYTAVVGDPAAPRCYVEVAWENDHVGVWFLDDDSRPTAHYSFTKVDDRTMFLDAVTVWEFPPGAGRRLEDAATIEKLMYGRDGVVRRRLTDVRTRDVTTEHWSDVPLDANWEPVPAFGDYRSVSRLERAGT